MKTILMLFVLFAFLPINANQLKNHSSPYLALHGNDPVNWMEWGSPAIEKAKKEGKLLFVSIGYFSCHWCHVMQRESYSNKDIAKQLNDNYISVKVDRELNPVLDKRLIEFVQVTTGTAGWPLNVFLTPEGHPLVGATYMPREHFSSVLKQLNKKWKSESVALTKQAENMSKTLISMLDKQEKSISGDATFTSLSKNYVSVAMQYADTLQGGFGQQRRFPQVPQLWALLKLNKKNKNKDADAFIQLTLDQMATKGLHDEIAGGFYRYTTDPDWEIPHFEKMIYTNAMMPLLYFDAAEYYKKPQYRDTALETLAFLKSEMRGSSNAFIASLSAVDSNNKEGGYYLWHQNELKKILTAEELNIANKYWGLNRPDELPSGNLPRQNLSFSKLATRLKINPEKLKNKLTYLKQKLKHHRNKTRKIPKDTKLLSGMNGLVLSAFSKGIKYDASLRITGEKLAQFLNNMWDGKALRRSAANAKDGTLYDYAAVSWGITNWGIATNNTHYKEIGERIAKAAWTKFYQNKSWVENPNSLLPKGIKQAHIPDNSLFSSEALLLESSYLSSNTLLHDKANKVLENVTRSIETDLFSYASLLTLSLWNRQ